MDHADKPADTEDKTPWLRFGEQREGTFLESVAPEIGLDADRNPAKDDDPTALDLLVDGEAADLKTQETPFFTAESNYDLPPQYVVTFNANDYRRYQRKNDPAILFWVRWHDELSGYGASVEEMEGVWRLSFDRLESMIESGDAPLHQYRRRIGDRMNANASYLLDLRRMDCLACFVGPC
ncbi:hypothetical protein [Natronosalvus vescus]|uniref:hypothetical protein n=1 Tax=Natronosalvus vescus TaxID=2953881 RepID=UPI002091B856|nr:hypothetical protein [Natronosalvus vescus]